MARVRLGDRRWLGASIALGGLVAALLVAAGGQTGCTSDAPAPSAPAPILIGVSLGLTGDLGPIGIPLRQAVKVAEGEINAAGGLLGRPVVFDVQDDESDEKPGSKVETIANDFVKRGAVAVIGPIGSQQVVQSQAIYAAGHVIQISPSATSTDLTTIQPITDRWFFRTTPADDFQGAAVLLYAQRTQKGLTGVDGGAPDAGPSSFTSCTKLAILNVDNSYGNSMADVIQTAFPKRNGGAQILTRKKVPVLIANNYATIAHDIVALAPQCLAVIAYDDVGARFVANFKADPGFATLPEGFFFIGTDGVFTSGFLSNSLANPSDPKSSSTAEGFTGTNPDTQPGTQEYNQFRTLYSSYFPLKDTEDAPAFAANAFDAAVLVALAIQKAQTVTDHGAVRDALTSVAAPPGQTYGPSSIGAALQAITSGNDIDYQGGSGDVDMQPNGNVTGGFIVWKAVRDPGTKVVGYTTIGRFGIADLTAELK